MQPGKEFNFALPIMRDSLVVRAADSRGVVVERALSSYSDIEDIPERGSLLVEGVASDTSIDQYKGKFSERAILGMVDCVNNPPMWKDVPTARQFVGIDIDHSKHWTDQIGRAVQARAIYELTPEQEQAGFKAPLMWVQAEVDLGMSHGRDLARSLYRGSKLGLSVWGFVKEGHVEVNRSTGEKTEHFDLVNLKQIAVTSQPVNKNTLLREVSRSMIGVTMPEMYSPDAAVGDGMEGIEDAPSMSTTPAGVLPGVGLTSAALADIGIDALMNSRAVDADNGSASAASADTASDFTASQAAMAAANANLRSSVSRATGEEAPTAEEVARAQSVQSNMTGKRGSGDVAKPAKGTGAVKGNTAGSDATQTKETFPSGGGKVGQEQSADDDGEIEDLDDQNEDSSTEAAEAGNEDGAVGGTGDDPDANVQPIAKRKSKPVPKIVGRSEPSAENANVGTSLLGNANEGAEDEDGDDAIEVLRSQVADQTEILRELPGMFESVSAEISRSMDALVALREAVAHEVAQLRGEWAAFKEEGVGRRGVIGRSEDWEPKPLGADLPQKDLSRMVRELAARGDKVAATNLLLGRLFEPEPPNPELPAELQELQEDKSQV